MRRWWHSWLQELRLIFTDPSVLLVMFGGVLFYAVLYPLPYLTNVPAEQAVAVVDQDRSALARQLVRMVDATSQVRVAARPASMADAQDLLARGKVHGLLVIPENFQRDVYLGRPTTLSYAGDASYFLIYSTIVEGLVAAGDTLAGEVQAARTTIQGGSVLAMPGLVQPVRLVSQAAFNPTAGYLNYVVPAVFALILHQTLLIVLGTVTVKDRLQRVSSGIQLSPLHQALPLRLLIILAIYLLLAMLYFGFFLTFYDIPRQAAPLEVLAVCLLFFAATGCLALCLGLLLARPEQAVVVALVSAMPLLFTAGFIWPLSNLPAWLNLLGWLFPAKAGIQALLQLNQMGSGFGGIRQELWILAAQLLGYGLLLLWLANRQSRQLKAIEAAPTET